MASRTKKASEKNPIETWAPPEIPRPPLEGKASDPRLSAALAARERWHGRSGRPALKSSTQAVAFVRERRLVLPTIPSVLPNLLDPIVGRALTPEEREESQAVKTLNAWMPEIRTTPDITEIRLCFQRPTLVQADLWPCLKPLALAREEEARTNRKLPPEVREALEILDRRKTIPLSRLGEMLDLNDADAERLVGYLESQLVVVSRTEYDDDEEKDVRVVESLPRWLERAPRMERVVPQERAWTFLFLAALRSAVTLWTADLSVLFPWSEEERESAIQEAMTTGMVIPYEEEGQVVYVASPVPR